MKTISPNVTTLHNAEEEAEMFRDLLLTKLRAVWSEADYLKRLTRGIPADDLHELMLSTVYEFAAETAILEAGVSREDFLEDMGTNFDVAMSDVEVDEEDEEDGDEPALITPPPTPVRSVQDLITDVTKDA